MPRPMARSILVVARHNEDISWLGKVTGGWNVKVVQKNNDIPNKGREVSSFFMAMFQLYPEINNDDVLVFVHGDPFHHCPNLMERLKGSFTGYTPLGIDKLFCREDGSPHHPGLPVGEKFKEWFGHDFPSYVEFHPGGEFAITGKELKSYPIDFYRDKMWESMEDEVAWVFERLWKYFWT